MDWGKPNHPKLIIYGAACFMSVNIGFILLFTFKYLEKYGNDLNSLDAAIWPIVIVLFLIGTHNLYLWLKTPRINAEIMGYAYSPKTKYIGHFKNLTKFRPVIRYQDHNNATHEQTIINLGCILPEGSTLKLRIRKYQESRPVFLIYFTLVHALLYFLMKFVALWLFLLSFINLVALIVTVAILLVAIQIRDSPKGKMMRYMFGADPIPEEYNSYSQADFREMKLQVRISQTAFLCYRHYKWHRPKEFLVNIGALVLFIWFIWYIFTN